MALAKDTGFLLRKTPYSESSLIFKAFTRNHGLMSFMVKGAKRPGSRFRGLLEPVLHLELLFPEASRSELRHLSEIGLLRGFDALRGHPGKHALAQVFAEILLRYPPGESDAAEFHDLLLDAQSSLDSLPGGKEQLQTLLFSYLLRFCRISGFGPQFRVCVRCGAPATGAAVAFLLDYGGPVCSLHRDESGSVPLRESALRWLEEVQDGGAPAPLGRTDAWRVETFLLHYLGRHAGGEKTIKALPVWHELMEVGA